MSVLSKFLDKYRKTEAVTLKVGIMGGKTYPDGTPVAGVGYANEYGTPTIPARPFFRSTIEKNASVLPEMVASLIEKHGPEAALRMVGEHMTDELKESVMTWSDPPNAQSTVDQKGYNAPLRGNDRLLRNSFSYEIEQ